MSCQPCDTPIENCGECQSETPTPILPRCNNALIDGTYTNTTIVVNGGCIADIQQGTPFLYTPSECCAPSGSGGGGMGGVVIGPQGPAGRAATITAGTVTIVPQGSPARVVNVGTTSDAIFNFEIPSSGSGGSTSTSGVSYTDCAITIVNGLITAKNDNFWPPVYAIVTAPNNTSGISLTFTKQPNCETHVAVDTTGLRQDITEETANVIDAAVQSIQEDYTNKIDVLNSKMSQILPAVSMVFRTVDAAGSALGTVTPLSISYGVKADGSDFNDISFNSASLVGTSQPSLIIIGLLYNNPTVVSPANVSDKIALKVGYHAVINNKYVSAVFDTVSGSIIIAIDVGYVTDTAAPMTFTVDLVKIGVW